MLGWQHRPAAARGSRARGSAHAPIFKSHWNAQHAARQQPRSTGRDQCQQQETCSTSNGSAHSGDWDVQRFMHVLKQRREAEGSSGHAGPGKVFLVGTGPGDPGLLTLRAVQLMQSADVVLYDRLVSDDILRLVHGGARMVYVGKQAGYHTRTQAEIHELLLQFAEAGATVVRLKGGDPYVFGRGGEEVQYLQQQGITVQCVPGITAAAGICAELGIPMTHRGVATSVRFLTGHAREGGQAMLDDTIVAAADPNTTLVVYMGLSTLPQLVQQLQQHGLPADVPAVAVERGTTAEQRVVFGTLADLQEGIQAVQLKSPTLLIIGQVVALSPGWQEWRETAAASGAAAAQVDCVHDCARLQLPDAVAAVLQQQQQPQDLQELSRR